MVGEVHLVVDMVGKYGAKTSASPNSHVISYDSPNTT